jgi:hypothetical protein
MADEIKELSMLPREQQEFVLENLSHDYSPIEIDGNMYMIPQEVNDLIDSLAEQIATFRMNS